MTQCKCGIGRKRTESEQLRDFYFLGEHDQNYEIFRRLLDIEKRLKRIEKDQRIREP